MRFAHEVKGFTFKPTKMWIASHKAGERIWERESVAGNREQEAHQGFHSPTFIRRDRGGQGSARSRTALRNASETSAPAMIRRFSLPRYRNTVPSLSENSQGLRPA